MRWYCYRKQNKITIIAADNLAAADQIVSSYVGWSVDDFWYGPAWDPYEILKCFNLTVENYNRLATYYLYGTTTLTFEDKSFFTNVRFPHESKSSIKHKCAICAMR